MNRPKTALCRDALVVALVVAVLDYCPASETLASDPTRADFSVVLLPDTQCYALEYPETFMAQTEWIKEHVKADNIRFVIHLGDIVETNTEEEWKRADKAMRVLDSSVPYSVLPGNHDMTTRDKQDATSTLRYNKYFGPARYQG